LHKNLLTSYASYVFLGTAAPGEPIYRTPPETWTWILNDSINFFYVNIFAKFVGLSSIPTPDGNPVSEALFNFVNAWSLMFWPLILADSKRHRTSNKFWWWTGIMFLTNAFMVPYMAVRERLPETDARGKPPKESPRPLASFSKLFGGVALFISVVSLFWLFQVCSNALSSKLWKVGTPAMAGGVRRVAHKYDRTGVSK